MKKKISKKISNKIVTEQDIKEILDYLFTVYSEIDTRSKTFSISLYSNDSEVYEIQDTLIEDEINILRLKRISKISVYLSDYSHGKKISLELSQDSDYYTNTLTIESNDENWVNNQSIKLKEFIDSWKPQNTLFSKYKNFLLHFFATNIGLLFIKVLNNLFAYIGYKSKSTSNDEGFLVFIIQKMVLAFPLSKYLIIGLFSWLVGIIICALFWTSIEEKLLKLWPTIEFDFGPEHLKHSKRNRKLIWYIFTLVILPIILQFVFTI